MKTTIFSALSRLTLRFSLLLIVTCIVNPSAYAQLLDSDSDGMPDEWEMAFGLNSSDAADAATDLDADGLNNLEEYEAGTNPTNGDSDFDQFLDGVDIAPANPNIAEDSDADGLPDSWEVVNGLDPLFPDDAGYLLHDGDGLTVLEEYLAGTDFQDDDSDNDGVLDGEDVYPLQSAYQYDSDSDGLPDIFELQFFFLDPLYAADAADDFDLDGLTNLQEFTRGLNLENQDSDLDGVPDGEDVEPLNPRYRFDSDNDGLPDAWEIENGLDENTADRWLDLDGDYATNLQEYLQGTLANTPDTDNDNMQDGFDRYPLDPRYTWDSDRDGMPDNWESEYGLNPSDILDGRADSDGDQVTNYQEFILGTSPLNPDSDYDLVPDNEDLFPTDRTKALDSDNDGLYDAWEVINGLDPFFPGDALELSHDGDSLNVLAEYLAGTNFRDEDTDGDGVLDGVDLYPLDSAYQLDSDNDGLPDAFENRYDFLDPSWPYDTHQNFDMDGLSNLEEFQQGLDPSNPDSDFDGVFDGEDVEPGNARYALDDDGDGLPDMWERENGTNDFSADGWLDQDGDGLTNAEEYRIGTLANNPDTDNDGWSDGYDYFPLDSRYWMDQDRDGMPYLWENQHGLSDSDTYDGGLDSDVDQLINSQEFLRGTSPNEPDSDFDGVIDGLDLYPTDRTRALDTDQDGLPDAWEVINGFDPFNPNDAMDTSHDNDTLNVLEEYLAGTNFRDEDSDNDGVLDGLDDYSLNPNYQDNTDTDKDGMPDEFELEIDGLSIVDGFDAYWDFDGDNLSNIEEYQLGTDIWNRDSDFDGWPDDEDVEPTNPKYGLDSDNDGLPDKWEIENGTNIYRFDASLDDDGDLFTNIQEYRAGTFANDPDSDRDGYYDGDDHFPLDPQYGKDSDRDGMPDQWEFDHGLSAYDTYDGSYDGDGDQLSNSQEYLLGTSPYEPDSDFDGVIDGLDLYPADRTRALDSDEDGLPDGWEVINGFDPFYSLDATEYHHDSDTLNVLQEYLAGTDWRNGDTDGDGVFDGEDDYPLNPSLSDDTDADKDGIPDEFEAQFGFLYVGWSGDVYEDYDGDGLTNLQEYQLGTDLINPDTDADGSLDGEDPEPKDPRYAYDSDEDGLPDAWERANGTYVDSPDSRFDDDGDSLTNLEEYRMGTLPNNPDSDFDGVPDGIDHFPRDARYSVDGDRDGIPRQWEEQYGTSDEDTYDGARDDDNDNLINSQEFIRGTSPWLDDTDFDGVLDGNDLYPLDRTRALDSDQDGLPDSWEIINGLDPFYAGDATEYHHDNDSLNVLEEYLAGTDFRDEDSDHDGVPDDADSFPLSAAYQSDFDGDGMPDLFESQIGGLDPSWSGDAYLDFDDDGLTNLEEFELGTHIHNPDSDFDGVRDGDDIEPTNSQYRDDFDGDGLPDAWEDANSHDRYQFDSGRDDDGDLFTSIQEYKAGTSIWLADSDGDGAIDSLDHFPLDSRYTVDGDRDGMPYEWEARYFWDEYSDNDIFNGGMDPDNDQLNNAQEFILGTSPNLPDSDFDGVIDSLDAFPMNAMYQQDSDFDGMPDAYEERYYFLDPYFRDDAANDYDLDRLSNLEEFERGADPRNPNSDGDILYDGDDFDPTDPRYMFDSDNDGLPDSWEIRNGTQVNWPDADEDFDGDYLTNIREYRLGTSAAERDSDQDGVDDSFDHFPLNPLYSRDADRDGIPDEWEQQYGLSDNFIMDGGFDNDNDLLINALEFLRGTSPLLPDTDFDGVMDAEDLYPLDPTRALDTDHDGLPDSWEVKNGLDPYFRNDANELDHDYDQLTVREEYILGTDFRKADTDGDGLRDGEDAFPLDPAYQFDSDFDGMPDAYEIRYGLIPNDIFRSDAYDDLDNDGLTNLQEFELGTLINVSDSDLDGSMDVYDPEPLSAQYILDSDYDGLPDRWENEYGTDMSRADSGMDLDGDLLSNLREYQAGTLPNNPDSDGDGVLDGPDLFPLNPRYSMDNDRDGMPQEWEARYGLRDDYMFDGLLDNDNDQLNNSQEFIRGTSPDLVDSDFDGVWDNEDAYPMDPTRGRDTDEDGLPDEWEILNGLDPFFPGDAQELSHDADKLTVLQEYHAGTDFRNEDSDGDGRFDDIRVGPFYRYDDIYPLNPEYRYDSDNDGLPDAFEEQYLFLYLYTPQDAFEDYDFDGLTNLQEFTLGTDIENPDSDNDGVFDGEDPAPLNPDYAFDSDGDGLPDAWEIANGTDLNRADDWLDLDGDYLTSAQEYRRGTDATNPDTDGDSVLDGMDHYPLDSRYTRDEDRDGLPLEWEIQNGLSDGDVLDAISDLDNDGVTNLDEYLGGTDPQNAYDYPGAPVTTLQNEVVIGTGTGSVASNGDSSYVLTSNTVSIEYDSDSYFVYTVLPMDGEATVQMTNINGADFTRAGLMIRDELTMDSPYAVVAMTQGKGTGMFWVENAGESETQLNEWNAWYVTQPYWLRIVRSGNEITGYRSEDAITWAEIETVTVVLSGDAYIGLGFYGNNTGSDATVSFNSFSLTLNNQAPEVTVSGGVNGLLIGDTLTLSAIALDEEDGDLTESVQWTDGTNTAIGETFSFTPVSIGDYQISASVTDSFGSVTVETITVSVVTDLGVLDDDSDGLSNNEELALGTDPLIADTDGDGLLDGEEVSVYGSDPLSTDSDADGLEDGYEVEQGFDPAVADSDSDADGDGVSNLDEYLSGTDPLDSYDYPGAAQAALLNDIVIGDGNGSYVVAGDSYTLTSNTVSIEYDPDSYFVYAPLSVDGEAIVQMTNINGDAFTRGGLMIRDELTMDSSYAVVAMTQGKGTGMFWVESTGAVASEINEWNAWYATQPYWLRLVRSGDLVTGYRSEDAITWDEIGAVTVEFSGDAYIGLGFYGNNTGQDATVSFDNFSLIAP